MWQTPLRPYWSYFDPGALRLTCPEYRISGIAPCTSNFHHRCLSGSVAAFIHPHNNRYIPLRIKPKGCLPITHYKRRSCAYIFGGLFPPFLIVLMSVKQSAVIGSVWQVYIALNITRWSCQTVLCPFKLYCLNYHSASLHNPGLLWGLS